MFEPNQHTPDNSIIPTVDSIKEKVAPIDRSKRKEEVDKLYEQFLSIMKRPVILEYEEFLEFLPLFSEENLKKLEGTTDLNALYNYHMLANKFVNRINPYKEYFVRTLDGELIRFPPVLNVILPMAENERHYVDIYSNIATNASDQPWKLRKAIIDVTQALARSQNIEIIRAQIKKFQTITEDLKKQYLNNKKQEEGETEVSSSGTSLETKYSYLEEEPTDM